MAEFQGLLLRLEAGSRNAEQVSFAFETEIGEPETIAQ
jgi:hypothetical protein